MIQRLTIKLKRRWRTISSNEFDALKKIVKKYEQEGDDYWISSFENESIFSLVRVDKD
ncbi:MAG: hypothetical protein Fur0024_2420 [Patescibacteria group bacterium]